MAHSVYDKSNQQPLQFSCNFFCNCLLYRYSIGAVVKFTTNCRHLNKIKMSGDSLYECIGQIVSDGGAKCTKYRSKKSGMTICIGEVNGPLVSGYFCVATEAHDDDGLPHTLEHLVFMGSEKYPYKGYLDLVASRCLSNGTNAWTDTDHTCYTVTTAGDEGFLNLLPIYLDHMLFPTLEESAYLTEVHHINKEGKDGGVVYCEMQARENSGECRCHLAMGRAMYPGNSGYKSQTGGLVGNIRESTSNQKVIAYHKKFYRPENLCLVIVGQIDASKVFDALKPVEERIAEDGQRPPFVRPWQSPIEPLAQSSTIKVEYPCDEDDSGLVIAAWRGPMANDCSQIIAIQILMEYLTDTSVAPISRDLVECEDPLSNQVDYTVIENLETCIFLHFSNVPSDQLQEAFDKCMEVLNNIANEKEELDMERMRTVIRKRKLLILSNMEDSPHDRLANCLIGDFLYGNTLDDMKNRLQEVPAIDLLVQEPSIFWLNLLKKYITENKYVVVLGKPSPEMATAFSNQENERIKKRIEELGPQILEEKGRILAAALKRGEIKPPTEVLRKVCIPCSKSIKFHPIKRVCNVSKTNENNVDFAVSKMPCRFHVDVIHTSFVRLYVLMDTSHLSADLRLFLPLFVELLDESAINRNGETVPYQVIVRELAEDTVSIFTNIGFDYSRFFCGKNAQLICLELMVEEEKYQNAVQWLHDILYRIVFEPERVRTTAKKIFSDLADYKRKGGSVAKTILKNLVFRPESNHWTASMMRQSTFLASVLKDLDNDPEGVMCKLNQVRELVTQPAKITVHLSMNLNSLKAKLEPELPWMEGFFPTGTSTEVNCSPIQKCHQLINRNAASSKRGLIMGLGSVETSYLIQCTSCLTSYKDPDYAPLLVLIQYLTQLEGPMWRLLRGKGLCYSYQIFLSPDSGLMYFVISKSTDIVKCYKEAAAITQSHLDGSTKWEGGLFESATSSITYDTIQAIKTPADATQMSLRAYYSDIDMMFTQELLSKISQVTNDDMERVGRKYLMQLFDFSETNYAICCPTNDVDGIIKGFKEISGNLEKLSSLEDELLTKY